MRMGMGYTLRRYGGWENASDGIETAEGNEEDGEIPVQQPIMPFWCDSVIEGGTATLHTSRNAKRV